MAKDGGMKTRTSTFTSLTALGVAALLAGCGANDSAQSATDQSTADQSATSASVTGATESGSSEAVARATLVDPSGAEQGTVTITPSGDGLEIVVQAQGLEPGFHGLHVHAIGTCEADSPDPADPSKTGDFLSSGGHLAGEDGAAHPEHAGDLPVLQVGANGEGTLTAHSDRLTRELLLDDDGSAVVVHAADDNYANIPTRYAAEGADDETTKAGDAGGRVLCGELRAP